jgi:ParB/RepB/Spo0J family partition protein
MLDYSELMNIQVEIVSMDDLYQCEVWHRQTYNNIDELAASIETTGLQEPLLVRSRDDGGYEVVRGNRRRLALLKNGATQAPVVIRDMTDEEVLIATAWDLDRDALSPLEEADLYDTFRQQGLTIEDVAVRVSRDVAMVRRRLTLMALVQEAKDELAAGRLDAGAAEELALYAPDVQRRALPQVAAPEDNSRGPMLRGQARMWLKAKFSLRLADAKFDKKDASLVPACGSCVDCTKRSGAQKDLFPDMTDDRCVDVDCWETKTLAAWDIRAALLRSMGKKVLSADEARTLFTPGQDRPVTKNYVLLDDTVLIDRDTLKWRDVLGGSEGLNGYAMVIVRNPTSGVEYEMISARDAAQAAEARRAAGKIGAVPSSLEKDTDKGREKARVEKVEQRLARATIAAIVGAIHDEIVKLGGKMPIKVWRLLARLIVDQAAGDVHKIVATRLELTSDAITPREMLHDRIEKGGAGVALAVAFEVLLSRGLATITDVSKASVIAALAKELGLDLSTIAQGARAAFASEENKRASLAPIQSTPANDNEAAKKQPLVQVVRRKKAEPAPAPNDAEYDAIVATVLETATAKPVKVDEFVKAVAASNGLDEGKVRAAIVKMHERKAVFLWGKGPKQTVRLPENEE